MQTKSYRRSRFIALLVCLLSAALGATAYADQSSSTHYMVNETQFGSGSSLQDCSTNYCAKTSAGDTTVGNANSTNYSAVLGFNSSDIPLLEVIATGGIQNLGVLDTSHTGTASSSVKVRSYLSNGYSIQIAGTSPSQGSHGLTTLATPSTSQPGTEQFGINLAANTAPSIGLAAIQVPSSTFSYGGVTGDYSTSNLFKYVNGDIIAQSTLSTGETDYTISMILNISNTTPGGQYNGSYSAVVVPAY